MISDHTGIAGHCGYRATQLTIAKYFYWTSILKDVETFVRSCLHWLSTASVDTVPRPLGHALNAESPNQMVHFDYCYVMRGEDDFKYVLIVKDDFSGYV